MMRSARRISRCGTRTEPPLSPSLSARPNVGALANSVTPDDDDPLQSDCSSHTTDSASGSSVALVLGDLPSRAGASTAASIVHGDGAPADMQPQALEEGKGPMLRCGRCATDRYFNGIDVLRQHFKDVHVPEWTPGVGMLCGWRDEDGARCKKDIQGSRSHFRWHLETHVKAKLYVCRYCGRAGKSKQAWKRHEKRHTDEAVAFPMISRVKRAVTATGAGATLSQDTRRQDKQRAAPLARRKHNQRSGEPTIGSVAAVAKEVPLWDDAGTDQQCPLLSLCLAAATVARADVEETVVQPHHAVARADSCSSAAATETSVHARSSVEELFAGLLPEKAADAIFSDDRDSLASASSGRASKAMPSQRVTTLPDEAGTVTTADHALGVPMAATVGQRTTTHPQPQSCGTHTESLPPGAVSEDFVNSSPVGQSRASPPLAADLAATQRGGGGAHVDGVVASVEARALSHQAAAVACDEQARTSRQPAAVVYPNPTASHTRDEVPIATTAHAAGAAAGHNNNAAAAALEAKHVSQKRDEEISILVRHFGSSHTTADEPLFGSGRYVPQVYLWPDNALAYLTVDSVVAAATTAAATTAAATTAAADFDGRKTGGVIAVQHPVSKRPVASMTVACPITAPHTPVARFSANDSTDKARQQVGAARKLLSLSVPREEMVGHAAGDDAALIARSFHRFTPVVECSSRSVSAAGRSETGQNVHANGESVQATGPAPRGVTGKTPYQGPATSEKRRWGALPLDLPAGPTLARWSTLPFSLPPAMARAGTIALPVSLPSGVVPTGHRGLSSELTNTDVGSASGLADFAIPADAAVDSNDRVAMMESHVLKRFRAIRMLERSADLTATRADLHNHDQRPYATSGLVPSTPRSEASLDLSAPRDWQSRLAAGLAVIAATAAAAPANVVPKSAKEMVDAMPYLMRLSNASRPAAALHSSAVAGSSSQRLEQGHNTIHKRRPSCLQDEAAAVDPSADTVATSVPLSKRAKASNSSAPGGLDVPYYVSPGAHGETQGARSGSVHSIVGNVPLSGLRQQLERSARVVSTAAAAAASCDEESRAPGAARHQYFMDDFLRWRLFTQTGRRSYTSSLGMGKYTITVHVPPPQGTVTCRICPEGESPDYTTVELCAHIKGVHANEWRYGMPCPWRGANGAVCGKVADQFKSSFERHLQTHLEPYKCVHCHCAFKSEARLSSHVAHMHGSGAVVSGTM